MGLGVVEFLCPFPGCDVYHNAGSGFSAMLHGPVAIRVG